VLRGVLSKAVSPPCPENPPPPLSQGVNVLGTNPYKPPDKALKV